MRKNVFLRSTVRQPVRTLVSMLLLCAAVFAFTSRAAEYLLIRRETERIGGYYKSVGQLSALEGGAAVSEPLVRCLEADPRVQWVDRRRVTSAVLRGEVYNPDIGGISSAVQEEVGNRNGVADVFFSGSLLNITRGDTGDAACLFRVDTVLAGYPEYIVEGKTVSLIVPADAEEAQNAVGALKIGSRYVLHGYYDYADARTKSFYNRPVNFFLRPLAEGAPWYFETPEGQEIDWDDPALRGVKRELDWAYDNQHALEVITTKDMSAMPDVHESVRSIFLTDGRWLDSADQEAGSRVCVVNVGFAQLRGLSVGDVLPLEFRSVKSPVNGYAVYPEDLEAFGSYETHAESYEIVGIYDYSEPNIRLSCFMWNQIYLPDSTVPDNFSGWDGTLSLGTLSFSLSDPADEGQFLLDTREELAGLGVRAAFLDSGWSGFHAVVSPLLRSSLSNVVIYTAVFSVTAAIVLFIYLRARRREAAIARAMGSPPGACAARLAMPFQLMALVSVIAGAVWGWDYAAEHAAGTLSALAEFSAAPEPALPSGWLLLLCGALSALLLAAAYICASIRVRRPVLEQFQDRSGKKERRKADAGADSGRASRPAAASAGHAQGAGAAVWAQSSGSVRRPTAGATLRFVRRYIARSRTKAALFICLTVLFTLGLASVRIAIENSGARMDALYEDTVVEMELIQADPTIYVGNGGFISQATIDRIIDTGYVSGQYLEGECVIPSVSRVQGDGTKEIMVDAPLVACSDLSGFLSGRGGNIALTYRDGWDEGLFAEDWNAPPSDPACVSPPELV